MTALPRIRLLPGWLAPSFRGVSCGGGTLSTPRADPRANEKSSQTLRGPASGTCEQCMFPVFFCVYIFTVGIHAVFLVFINRAIQAVGWRSILRGTLPPFPYVLFFLLLVLGEPFPGCQYKYFLLNNVAYWPACIPRHGLKFLACV